MPLIGWASHIPLTNANSVLTGILVKAIKKETMKTMIEVEGNIWDYKSTVICVTTNAVVKRNGALVMGRGVAKQCLDRNPGIDFVFGKAVSQNGSIMQILTELDQPSLRLLALFPVKQHWRQSAKLGIIERSATELGNLAEKTPNSIFVLPRPGCGNGNLSWREVKPIIEHILPNNVHVIHLPGE